MSEADKQYLAKKKLKRMEDNSAWFGYFIMIVVLVFAIIIFCFGPTARSAHAGELDAWEFRFFGINYKDFENREFVPIAVGVVSSFVAHELGHVLSARAMGTDSYFSFSDRAAYAGDGYSDLSTDQKALYHGAGFLAQTLVGGILTAIPATRHNDFTLGFNTFSSVTGFFYGVTGGLVEESSDVQNLDKYGYNGTAIALGSGVVNGVFTYYSLDKVKE